MALEHRLHARCGCASLESSARATSRPFVLPASVRHFEPDRPFAVEHIAVELTLDVPHRSVDAVATLDVRRIDPTAEAIALDAVAFDLRRLTVDGLPAAYDYDGQTLVVPVAPGRQTTRIAVDYRVTPRRGLYFLEPDQDYPDRPRQVWSQCQEQDARHFVPCHDSPNLKSTTEIVAHVPAGWYALSNGDLVAKDESAARTSTFHWRMSEPHSSYLITLVAGEFSEIADRVSIGEREIPVTYLVPKGREEDARRALGRTPEMIRHFSEVTGVPYPWNKYAQVVVSDFIFGGMENTTATTLYEHVLLDERAALDVTSDDLVSHELAHQWFGDYVTCRAWYEGWLNEGFATFFEHVWRDHRLGRDEYFYGLRADLEAYVHEAHDRYRRPIVCQDYDAPLDLFDRHLYEKGGLVLHAMRAELGDALFWRGVRAYLDAHARGVVETRDLQRAMEGVSGRSLGRLFEQWVHRPGHAELDVTIAWSDGILTLEAKQTQSTTDGVPAVFETPLEVEIADGGGAAERRVLRMTERHQSFAVPAPTRPSHVVVDPEMRIVGEVRVKAPGGMLRRQLEAAATARGRWLAAQALARTSDEASVSALGRVLAEEREFWGVRAECAAALGKIRGDRAFAALLAARRTTHPKVRRAVVEAIGRFRTADAQAVLQEYARRDASYLVEAEAARALGRTRQPAAFEALVSMLDRPSWFDVVRAGAIEGLAALRDERAVAPLHARVRPGYPQRVRRAAVSGLTKLAPDRKTRDALELLLEDADAILRMDVARSLGDLGDVKARGALRERLEIDDDPRVRRRIREALRDLAEPKRITDQLRDEIERLEHEQVGLKARLARLEAKAGGDAEQDRGKERAGGTGSRGRARRARPAKRAAGTRPKRRSR